MSLVGEQTRTLRTQTQSRFWEELSALGVEVKWVLVEQGQDPC